MLAGLLSTTQIKKYGHLPVILPLGAFEQHGPYLPLLTDALIAEAIASRMEQESPKEILLFPTIWFGASVEHRGFTGTLSVQAVNLINLLEDLFLWLEESGFRRGILLNAHGGNASLAKTACEEFSRDHTFKIKHHFIYSTRIGKLSKTLFGSQGSHAGSSESSLLSALYSELTPPSPNARKNSHPYLGGKEKFSLFPTKKLSKSGILEPSRTITIDREKGERLAAYIIEEAKAELFFLRSWK